MRRYGKQQKVDDKATVDIKKGPAKKGAQKLTGDDGYKVMDRSKECRVCLSLSLSCMLMKDMYGPRYIEGKRRRRTIIAGYY